MKFLRPLLVCGRLAWLTVEFILAAITYLMRCSFRSAESLPQARAWWLHHFSTRLLKVIGTRVHVTGKIPRDGLLVCNHLGYVDILVLASIKPCVFVAKNDVAGWPVFGWFARLAGTIFVDREKRIKTAETADEIEAVLRAGVLVVLFPEGTSTGGDRILPFKSSLLEPATRPAHALHAGLISYEMADGNVSEELCYWKDMTLVPHLINLCSKRTVQASVRFKQLREGNADRKQLARQLHAEVLRMKHAFAI